MAPASAARRVRSSHARARRRRAASQAHGAWGVERPRTRPPLQRNLAHARNARGERGAPRAHSCTHSGARRTQSRGRVRRPGRVFAVRRAAEIYAQRPIPREHGRSETGGKENSRGDKGRESEAAGRRRASRMQRDGGTEGRWDGGKGRGEGRQGGAKGARGSEELNPVQRLKSSALSSREPAPTQRPPIPRACRNSVLSSADRYVPHCISASIVAPPRPSPPPAAAVAPAAPAAPAATAAPPPPSGKTSAGSSSAAAQTMRRYTSPAVQSRCRSASTAAHDGGTGTSSPLDISSARFTGRGQRRRRPRRRRRRRRGVW